jgi:type I restriction enzyme, S subunit
MAEGSTGQTELPRGRLKSLLIPYPSARQQRAIAAVLGQLDDKIDMNLSLMETCWTFASTCFERAIGTPAETVPLGDVIDLAYGKALPAAKRMMGDVPVFGSGGLVGWHDSALVEGPGVIVGRKGTVGAVYWSRRPFFPIDTTFFVRTKNDLPMSFAYFTLRSLRLERMNSDSTVPGLNRAAALQRRVQIPSRDELSTFVDVSTPLIARAEAARDEASVLERLRDAILQPLLSGALRVRDVEMLMGEAV